MSAHVTANRTARKSHRQLARPPFECIALLLQGGGALGAYQAGVYEALAEAHLPPDWVAGISIGAVNAALIAGNPPHARVEKLREFWKLHGHLSEGRRWLMESLAAAGPEATPSVRAERDGNGDGRVYHISFTATGSSGSCTGSVTVGVPHDQGHGGPVDQGALYNSTLP